MGVVNQEIIEVLAEIWAGIDGKYDKFAACRASVKIDEVQGYYSGYLIEAEEMIVRFNRRGYEIISLEDIEPEEINIPSREIIKAVADAWASFDGKDDMLDFTPPDGKLSDITMKYLKNATAMIVVLVKFGYIVKAKKSE